MVTVSGKFHATRTCGEKISAVIDNDDDDATPLVNEMFPCVPATRRQRVTHRVHVLMCAVRVFRVRQRPSLSQPDRIATPAFAVGASTTHNERGP